MNNNNSNNSSITNIYIIKVKDKKKKNSKAQLITGSSKFELISVCVSVINLVLFVL